MASRPATITPTADNRGLIPAGSMLPDGGVVVAVSLTAYLVWRATPEVDGEAWESFDAVHGRPAPASPLVVFG